MQLTGKQISNKLIVFNTCKEGIQQQGIDVRVKRIFSVHDNTSAPQRTKEDLVLKYIAQYDGIAHPSSNSNS